MNVPRAVPSLSRRRLLRTAGAAVSAALAGCLGGGDDGDELEVAHGWISGADRTAIEALTDGFEDAHPDVDTNFKPIAGGDATGFEDVIRGRIDQDDPPSSFAWRPGGNLSEFSETLGDAGPDVRRAADLDGAHVPEVRHLCRRDDGAVAVPVGAHRVNCLFYDVDVVDSAGVDPTALSSVTDLLDALERVAANTDVTPMAHAMVDPQPTLQLFESILLAQGGRDAFRTYTDRQAGRSDVRSALRSVSTIVANYVDEDAGSVWPAKAAERLLDGDAAFLPQDDRTVRRVLVRDDSPDGANYGEDWDVVPFPGTDDIYAADVHSFVYPVDEDGENPMPAQTRAWLGYVGSRDGQRLFNARKGSVPTRTDVDAEAFGPYLSDARRDFESAAHRLPSLSRGLSVEPAVLADANRVIQQFVTGPHGLESATEGLLHAG